MGDLSGKHGTISSDSFETTYLDQFASTVEGDGAFFGNRSFVIHWANGTRLACANFEKTADANFGDWATDGCSATSVPTPTGSGSSSGSGSGSGYGSSNATATGPSPTGPTSSVTISAGSNAHLATGAAGLVSFAAAIFFLL